MPALPTLACSLGRRVLVAQVGLPYGGIGADLVGRPLRNELAEVEHEDLAREGQHRCHVVFDHEQRQSVGGCSPPHARRRPSASRWRGCPVPTSGSSSSTTLGWVARARPTSTSRARPRGRTDTWVLAMSVRPSNSSRASTCSVSSWSEGTGAEIDQVAPAATTLVVGPVRQHEVITHRQPHEQLGMLEGAGQPEAGPRLRAQAGDVPTGDEDATRWPGGAAPRSRRRGWTCRPHSDRRAPRWSPAARRWRHRPGR